MTVYSPQIKIRQTELVLCRRVKRVRTRRGRKRGSEAWGIYGGALCYLRVSRVPLEARWWAVECVVGVWSDARG